MKIMRRGACLVRRPKLVTISFQTGHLIRDRIADSICDYLSNGGDVVNVRRYYLRHNAYSPRLFLYLFRYDRTAGDVKKYRNDLDFLAVQIHIIDDPELRTSLQRIHESRTVEYERLLEKKGGLQCTFGTGSDLNEKKTHPPRN